MRLNKKEKERLFELMDVMTDRCPSLSIDNFNNDEDRKTFWGVVQKTKVRTKRILNNGTKRLFRL